MLDPLGLAASVDAWLAGMDAPSGGLVRIGLRSDDPDDLSLGEARLLGQADRVYHRRDIPPAILARARADAVRIASDGPPDAAGPGLILWLERQ